MPRLALALLVLGFLTLATGGCSKSYSDRDVHWLTIEEARAAMTDTGKTWLREAKPNAWIDPRDAVFYRVGHIPGALNVQLSDPEAFTRLEGYGVLMVYGEGYESPVADALIKSLLKDGNKVVKGLKLGYEGWIAAGERVEKGDDTAKVTGGDARDRWQREPVDDQ
jgi:rhodanese-related sulfurtransferase